MNHLPATIRVAIVEDRPRDREMLASMLDGAAGFECVAACPSAEEAIRVLPQLAPDVVLMDINMPGHSGIECVDRLRTAMPKSQFMMLTVYEDHDAIFRSVKAGATGYLLKKSSPHRILEAIRELLEGGAPMSGQIARKVLAAFGGLGRGQETPAERRVGASLGSGTGLSPVEQRVLKGLARGLLYKEVAEELSLSISTVRTHVWRIYRKLHVNNRTQAIRKAFHGRDIEK
jgi:DNA-binding NarL/FixJ family response regulator